MGQINLGWLLRPKNSFRVDLTFEECLVREFNKMVYLPIQIQRDDHVHSVAPTWR